MSPDVESRVTPLADHRYLVRLEPEDEIGDAVEVVVLASPGFLASIAPGRPDETLVVAGTVAYLLGRQSAADLPPQLDLEDVAAAYDDFPDELQRWLEARAERTATPPPE